MRVCICPTRSLGDCSFANSCEGLSLDDDFEGPWAIFGGHFWAHICCLLLCVDIRVLTGLSWKVTRNYMDFQFVLLIAPNANESVVLSWIAMHWNYKAIILMASSKTNVIRLAILDTLRLYSAFARKAELQS